MIFDETNINGDIVQLIFRRETAHGDYQDALYINKVEYEVLTPEDIENELNDLGLGNLYRRLK